MIKILKQILFRGNCEDSSKMILNLIVIQKRFWKDDIKKVKINIMENSLKTNFVQKKMWRFFKDDTELNCDTKRFVVQKLVILLFFTFSMLSFQNRFCITIKFSIIFKEFLQFLLNIIGIQRIFHNVNFYFFNVIFSKSFLYHD